MSFTVETEHPLALESPDYAHTLKDGVAEGGPVVDNSKNPKFNRKLYDLVRFGEADHGIQ